ncbi:DUF4007 family protein [Vibrio diazotrophicus]|uniref:DUF4007 family protein n=1 Tax=Vibrio diazotrophicus TaxID=685 RepID=UPI0022AEBC75|nr:DUF4007 family protein [Vibrio diazotrophicus]MCZ4373816.1 DUF4007 family protein [Vibrio diazotrophicus]
MKLNKKDSAFGRHETFPLRYSWLPKGYQEFKKNPKIFESDESTVRLGVGKNMVSSIKHWMKASQLLSDGNQLTDIASFLLDEDLGVDPYLEDEATIWLLHWLLSTNSNQSTTWFWFFNNFVSTDFDVSTMQDSLEHFISEQLEIKQPSKVTLKNDCAVLTRMYSLGSESVKSQADDVLDSPMSLLGLIKKLDSKRFSTELSIRPDLPLGIFGFAIAQCINEYTQETNRSTMPIKSLVYSAEGQPSAAAVFRLTESDFMTKLELLQHAYPSIFTIRETAGISQIYLENNLPIDQMKFLEGHYKVEQYV